MENIIIIKITSDKNESFSLFSNIYFDYKHVHYKMTQQFQRVVKFILFKIDDCEFEF